MLWLKMPTGLPAVRAIMYTNHGKFAELFESGLYDNLPVKTALEHKFLKLEGQ